MIEKKCAANTNWGRNKKQNMMDQNWKEYFYIYVQIETGLELEGKEMNDLITKKIKEQASICVGLEYERAFFVQ